jgi:sugar phosphate isomerase/epimerase
MSRFAGYLDDFGIVTTTLAGPLGVKFDAIRSAGFSQVMLDARDVVNEVGGLESAARAVKASGLRVSGLQCLRDFEGLTGRQHDYKVEVAKGMLQMAHALGAPLLLVEASTQVGSSADRAAIARDLRQLAMLAVPLGLKIGYAGHGAAHAVKDHYQAWDLVCRADMPNLGIAIDTAQAVASGSSLEDLDLIESYKIFALHLADFMQAGVSPEDPDRPVATPIRVFPGEGAHSAAVADLLRRLTALGFKGNYSFAACNADYGQLPAALVAERAWVACEWLGEDVLRRSVPLPGRLRLRQPTPS